MGFHIFPLLGKLLGVKTNVDSNKLSLGLVCAQNGRMFYEHMPSHWYCSMIFVICDKALVKVSVIFSNLFLMDVTVDNPSHLLKLWRIHKILKNIKFGKCPHTCWFMSRKPMFFIHCNWRMGCCHASSTYKISFSLTSFIPFSWLIKSIEMKCHCHFNFNFANMNITKFM
jgi:hypothetical protein